MMTMTSFSRRDCGYEPWARANATHGRQSSPEQVAEILASLDAARAEVARLRAQVDVVRLGLKVNGYTDNDGVHWVTDESVLRTLGGAR